MAINLSVLFSQNEPDFDRLLKVFFRRDLPDRVPFIELIVDKEVVGEILDEEIIPFDSTNRRQREAHLLQQIRFSLRMGWDYVPVFIHMPFLRNVLHVKDTAYSADGDRVWVDENRGVIETMEDFENYPWPTQDMINYSDFEFVGTNLPGGMKIIATSCGILEWAMWLMGFLPFAYAIYDQPDLIEAVFQSIEGIFTKTYEIVASLPEVGAMFLGDDMGFRSGTFIKPEHLRNYVFPRQKRLAEITHSYGKPFLIHSCGNLEAIMDELIEDVGIDGKHSFEDSIFSVGEAKQKYGDRISILGGVDVGVLVSSSENDVRAYTRRTLEACMQDGGYALGTGNSVANYVPVRNYLAMVDEGMKVGWYR